MDVYKKLGVKRIINCFDTYTLLGGATLSEEVRAAMEEADKNFAWMWDLEEKAGRRIAELVGAEAAFVTPGAFAGLAMGAAACMTGKDPEKMRRLPDTTGMKNEIIIQRCLRDFKYDRSMIIAGGKLVEVGDEHQGCSPEQIEAAISERTAAIHYMAHGVTAGFASENCNVVPLEEVVEIGHRHDVPIIVDAAYQCYPLEGLRKYVTMGVDLAAYSCKYFGGPNTAGLLLGRKDLIEAVALHSFLGQEGGPEGKDFLIKGERGPYASVFRGYKLDRSSIVGAVVALERYMNIMRNPEKVLRPAREKLDYLMKALGGIPDIRMTVLDARTPGVDPLKIALQITLDKETPEGTHRIARELMSGDPEIWPELRGNSLIINITSFRGLMLLAEGDAEILAERLKSVLSKEGRR
mgnify:CR=1 FL=1